ncbi:MAG: nucleoside transporter C-terminal domain-containing protein, partial [Pseudobdellovibrionaceae bacterium]
VGILNEKIPNIAGHLLIASILSAPATLIISKLMHPETDVPETLGKVLVDSKQKLYTNSIEAATGGAAEGLSLALTVAGMLLAFIALIALINGFLGHFGDLIQFNQWGKNVVSETFAASNPNLRLSFQLIMSWIFAPFTLFLGIPWSEGMQAGSLLGEKTVLNEFVAYLSLSREAEFFSARSNLILSYALCGFANFSSIAIQVGGIGSLIPARRGELAALGLRCVLGGTLCSFLIASMVAILI